MAKGWVIICEGWEVDDSSFALYLYFNQNLTEQKFVDVKIIVRLLRNFCYHVDSRSTNWSNWLNLYSWYSFKEQWARIALYSHTLVYSKRSNLTSVDFSPCFREDIWRSWSVWTRSMQHWRVRKRKTASSGTKTLAGSTSKSHSSVPTSATPADHGRSARNGPDESLKSSSIRVSLHRCWIDLGCWIERDVFFAQNFYSIVFRIFWIFSICAPPSTFCSPTPIYRARVITWYIIMLKYSPVVKDKI